MHDSIIPKASMVKKVIEDNMSLSAICEELYKTDPAAANLMYEYSEKLFRNHVMFNTTFDTATIQLERIYKMLMDVMFKFNGISSSNFITVYLNLCPIVKTILEHEGYMVVKKPYDGIYNNIYRIYIYNYDNNECCNDNSDEQISTSVSDIIKELSANNLYMSELGIVTKLLENSTEKYVYITMTKLSPSTLSALKNDGYEVSVKFKYSREFGYYGDCANINKTPIYTIKVK